MNSDLPKDVILPAPLCLSHTDDDGDYQRLIHPGRNNDLILSYQIQNSKVPVTSHPDVRMDVYHIRIGS
jgi:hypothetical protein